MTDQDDEGNAMTQPFVVGKDEKAKKDGKGGQQISLDHFTPRHVLIPNLKEKVELLYQYHPNIRRQYELAETLKVAPSTLATWINGVPNSDGVRVNPGTIPAKHLKAFANVFGVPGAILEMEDFAEYKNAYVTFESGRGAWEKLVRSLPDNDLIEIVVNEERKFVPPDEDLGEEGLLRVGNGDEVMLRVRNPGLRHGALLAHDRDGWQALRPTPRWKETEIGEALLYPRPTSEGLPQFAVMEGSGVHTVLAVFTRDPLPGRVLEALHASALARDELDQTVSFFNGLLAAGPEKCRMFSRRFLVTSSARRK